MVQYIKTTWNRGREYEFPITFILSEMIRGSFVGYNILTEI